VKNTIWQVSTTFFTELFQPYVFTGLVLGTGHFVAINGLFPEPIFIIPLKIPGEENLMKLVPGTLKSRKVQKLNWLKKFLKQIFFARKTLP
jgi:hypothetical protein